MLYLTFETNELKSLNQVNLFGYKITNNSSNYDAEVRVVCGPKAVYTVSSSGEFSDEAPASKFNAFGIRPVVVIPKSIVKQESISTLG